ncbi:hypothetical protein CEXT_354091 [Caerostris extrusa]|uniref:Uncharacterized protein n=1 Tax=Caerostris extrusa TaxID=172846 RepID=A0AAV4PV33_CAEEX|nr:hypothetical protein CEXT_354091 [Caerostris extrusa]
MGRNKNGIQNTLDIFLAQKIRASSIGPFIGNKTYGDALMVQVYLVSIHLVLFMKRLCSGKNHGVILTWNLQRTGLKKLGTVGVTECQTSNGERNE